MSKVQTLRAFVKQRLSLAAEEIFELFERTIAEYEEQLCRQNKLLDAVFKPQLQLHRADVQLLLVSQDQDPPEQREELWTNQEGEQLQGPEEADAIKFAVSLAGVKTEEDNDEEEAQSSQLHQTQPEEMKTEPDGEDCGGPGPAGDFNPDVQLLLVSKDQDPPEQQDWSSSLDQEDPPEPPHIKEEQEELWTNQKGEQLQGPEEADVIKFSAFPAAVKSEEDDDEEKPQSSQLHQTEEMEPEADGEDCGGPGPARNCDPGRHSHPDADDKTPDCSELDTDDSEDWQTSRKPQSGLRFLKMNKRRKTGEKPWSCSECGKRFDCNSSLQIHERIHSGEKPFSCSICSKRFRQKSHLTRHTALHTEEKHYSCKNCGQIFIWESQLKKHQCVGRQSSQLHHCQTEENRNAEHLKIKSGGEDCGGPEPARNLNPECATSVGHKGDQQRDSGAQTGLKSFSCSVLVKKLPQKKSLTDHMRVHSEGKCFSCSVCKKSFHCRRNLETHMRVHTAEEKPFSCSVCGKGFAFRSDLTLHLGVHTGEKPFHCSVCRKRFSFSASLTKHMRIHTGEKPYTCPQCRKRFSYSDSLTKHMRLHTGEKPFTCSVCGKSFCVSTALTNHMRVHTGEKPFTCTVCQRRFATSSQMTRHGRVHSREKPFSCSVCGKKFTQKRSLTKHLTLHT